MLVRENGRKQICIENRIFSTVCFRLTKFKLCIDNKFYILDLFNSNYYN